MLLPHAQVLCTWIWELSLTISPTLSYREPKPLIFRPFSVLQDIVGEVNWTNSQS